ncbi:MAG: extensin family protein [Paracoccaceae bacterium]|mgnify:CR=1 FL=1
MMRAVLMLLMLNGGVALAERDDPVRPTARPLVEVAAVQVRPQIRPEIKALSLRPLVRPKSLEQKAMAKRRAVRRGSVCGDVDLQGEVVGAVPGRIRGCGIPDAIRLKSVAGVRLSQEALMDCRTAVALKTWVNNGAKPALQSIGGGLDRLRVAAHYSCRTRNNQPGAKISEHGKGRAIDISAFYLRDGTEVSVLTGWNARSTSRAMRQMHRAACGPFGTVLGPESDRFHRDHFHFDTAQHRGGAYCR